MLTPSTLKNLQLPHGKKQRKFFDSAGLYLLINQTSKGWRFKYKFNGKEKLISLGKYPAVSLELARARADDARRLLALEIDPAADRKASAMVAAEAQAATFGVIGEEYLTNFEAGNPARRTVSKNRWVFGLLKKLHSIPAGQLTAPQVIAVLRKIESVDDRRETAHRAGSLASRIMRYACQTGRIHANPIADLRGVLKPVQQVSHPAVTEPDKVGRLLAAIRWYDAAHPTVKNALQLLPYVFVRPGELRHAEWAEMHGLEGKAPEWRIPAGKMKMRNPHIVPLSKQAAAILLAQREHTGKLRYVFPSGRGPSRPMSDGALSAALNSLFYDRETIVPHGFRAMASTLLNDSGKFDSALIELQLAHVKKDKVEAVYNRALRLSDRREMMQWYADYLDELRTTAERQNT